MILRRRSKVLGALCLMLALLPLKVGAQGEPSGGIAREGYGMVKTNIGTTYCMGWGNIKDAFQTRVSYEAFSSKSMTFTANARYSSARIDFGEADLSHGYRPDDIGMNGMHSMGQIGFTTTFKTKVLGMPFMGMAMVNSEWDGGDFARVSGMAMGLFMLRASRDTQFGVGPLVMVNSTSRLPAFLVFLYRHHFNDRWLLNLYGGMFSLDYTPTRNDLLSIGADIDSRAFYFSPNDSTLPSRCRFTSTSIRPMVKYRRRLARSLYLDVETGVALRMSCRVNGVSGSKEYFHCSQKPALFFQMGASYSL